MPFFAILAAAVPAVIGAGASIYGASKQSDAAGHSADLQKAMFDETRADLKPFIGAGSGAIPQLQDLLGLGTGGIAGETDALRKTPGYQFQLDEGLNAILSKATATGGVGGGNTLKDLMRYGTGLADSTFQQQVGNTFNLASLGESAAAGQGQISAGVGSNIGNSLMQAGNAQAGGAAGVASAANSGVSNFLLSQFLNQGGGAAGATSFGIPAELEGLV